MFNEAIKYIKLTFELSKLALLSQMEYRISFIIKVFGMILNDAAFIVIWYIYFTRFPSINGWTLRESLLLLSISTFSYGWILFIARGLAHIARSINRGELDFFLSFPVSPLWFIGVSRCELSSLGDVLFGLGLLFFIPNLTIFDLLLYPVLGLLAGIIFGSFLVISQALAFYIPNFEDGAEQLWWTLLGFTLYPLSVFEGALKVMIYTLFPAFFMCSIPVRILTNFNIWDLLILAAFSSGIFLLAITVFTVGLKRYESGNLIANRL